MFFTERLTMDFISYRRSKAAQAAGGSEGGSHTSHDDHGGCFSNDEEEASSAGTTTHYSGGLHVHGGAHAHGHLCLDVIHAAHAAMPPPPTARPHDHGAAGDDCLQKPPPPASAASAGAATRGAYATAFLLEFSIMVHSIVIGLDVGLDSERSVSDLIVFTGCGGGQQHKTAHVSRCVAAAECNTGLLADSSLCRHLVCHNDAGFSACTNFLRGSRWGHVRCVLAHRRCRPLSR